MIFLEMDYMTGESVVQVVERVVSVMKDPRVEGRTLDLYVSEIRRFGSKAYRIAEMGLLNKALQVFHKKEEMKRVCGGRDKIKPFKK